MKSLLSASILVSALLASGIVSVRAQGTAFTYQGRLRDNTIPAAGAFDLRFGLYDSEGVQIGSILTFEDVAVSNGLFCVELDFGLNAFSGAERWLETSLRAADEQEETPYTTLAPRRRLTAAPYALYAPTAGTAATATTVPAGNITGIIPLARLPGEVVTENEAGVTLSGTFSGNGAGLSGVNADGLDGEHGSFYQNAANLTSGTLSDARLSANVALLNGSQVFSGSNLFTGGTLFSAATLMTNADNILAGTHAGDGASLSNLTATALVGIAPKAAEFTGLLAGDVTGAQGSTAVEKVGGVTAADVAAGAKAANQATAVAGASTLVKRDASGGFAAGMITATFAGAGSELTELNASQLTGGTVPYDRLSGDVKTGIEAANAATSSGTPHAIVKRDANGSFAGNVTGTFAGDGSGLTNIPVSSIVGSGGGGGTLSLPSGITVVSMLPNDANLLASGCAWMMTVPAPPWVTSLADGSASGRFGHSAVWDGKRLILWGGRPAMGSFYLNTGGLYLAELDEWESVSTVDAPSARWGHTAVWGGSEMLIWGGNGESGRLNTGGRFHPDSQRWRAIPVTGAPSARTDHIAIWTGEKMFVWGGQNASGLLKDGGFYVPSIEQWSAVTSEGAPAARIGATATWANDRVLIWGGEGETGVLNSGAQLRFDTGTPYWVSMASDNAPLPRRGHSAIWTGTRMIVWGGQTGGVPYADGAAYDPATDSWEPIPTLGSPTARFDHAAVWTGQEMLILGGSNGAREFAPGAAYNPATGVWRALSSLGNPLPRTEATATWAGTEVLVFGGRAHGMAVGPLQRLVPQPVWYFYRKL